MSALEYALPALAAAALLALVLSLLRRRWAPSRERLFNMLPDGVLVVRGSDHVIDANLTLHQLMRLPADPGSCRASLLLARYPEWLDAVREQRDDRILIQIAGRDYEVSVSCIDTRGGRGTLSTVRDVTETQILLRRLEEQSQRDALTGILNRRAVVERYARLVEFRPDCAIGMLVIDLDDFKSVNDRFGHQVGDDALVSTAQCLEQQLRGEDLLCRMGGEEFVVVMPGIDLDSLAQRAEEVRQAIEQQKHQDGKFTLTASIGVSRADMPVPFEALFRVADDRLYDCKRCGKNQVCGPVSLETADQLPLDLGRNGSLA